MVLLVRKYSLMIDSRDPMLPLMRNFLGQSPVLFSINSRVFLKALDSTCFNLPSDPNAAFH